MSELCYLAAPAHHLCFATCNLEDAYGDMDATLMNGAQCFWDTAGQHDVELADVFEIGYKSKRSDEVQRSETLLKSYINPVVSVCCQKMIKPCRMLLRAKLWIVDYPQ